MSANYSANLTISANPVNVTVPILQCQISAMPPLKGGWAWLAPYWHCKFSGGPS